MTLRTRLGEVAIGLGRRLRDAWLVLGIAIVILVAVEIAYRAQATVRSEVRKMSANPMARPPYADSAWYPQYTREFLSSSEMRWTPYVYFRRRPFSGSFVNVDTCGLRRTVPRPRTATDTLRVFFFGGSTMWGTDQRDSATIASVTARRLSEVSPPRLALDVTNLGESGYIVTQEVIELQMLLRAGTVPDVVIFVDGINDVAAAAQAGRAGVPQNESNRARDFEVGRDLYGYQTGIVAGWRAARALGNAISRQFLFVRRVGDALPRPRVTQRSPDSLAMEVVNNYAANVDIIEALSLAYGFKAMYVWQPTLQTTTKLPTPFEKDLLRRLDDGGFQQRLRALHRLVEPKLDSTIGGRVGRRFVRQSSLFSGDTISAFTDLIGHNTEKAIPTIVDAFLPTLVSLIDSTRIRSPRDARAQRQRTAPAPPAARTCWF